MVSELLPLRLPGADRSCFVERVDGVIEILVEAFFVEEPVIFRFLEGPGSSGLKLMAI